MGTPAAAGDRLNPGAGRRFAQSGFHARVDILGGMKMTSRSLLFPVVAASALLLLSACGNKGPLVMPQKPVPIEEQPVEPVDDAASQDDADRKAQDAVDEPSPAQGEDE